MRTTSRVGLVDKTHPLPKLSISIRDESESLIAFHSLIEGASQFPPIVPWIDVSDPSRGTLGQPDLGTALSIYKRLKHLKRTHLPSQSLQFSVALGELTVQSDVELSNYCDAFGEDAHFKIGLSGLSQVLNWEDRISRLVQSVGHPSQWILVHYADAEKADAPTWDSVLQVSKTSGCEVIWVDTWERCGQTLLDVIALDSLKHMAAHSQAMGLEFGVAGSLQMNQLDALSEISPNWIGFRSDLCESPSCESSLSPQRIRCIIDSFRSIHSEAGAVARHVIR